VLSAKKSLSSLGVSVTVSELAYGYQKNGGAQDVLDAVDFIDIHMLPFFSSQASTGKASPPFE
jgi:exo-beta-1,3-glucanase (GH17 family)